jgi:hypothetical protein
MDELFKQISQAGIAHESLLQQSRIASGRNLNYAVRSWRRMRALSIAGCNAESLFAIKQYAGAYFLRSPLGGPKKRDWLSQKHDKIG